MVTQPECPPCDGYALKMSWRRPVGLMLVVVAAFVPAAASGLAFGALGGSLIACAGAVGGGLAAFALARTVARQQADRLVQSRPRLSRIHALLERRGFAAILAARLMPGVPATALHYAAGVSPVGCRAFA